MEKITERETNSCSCNQCKNMCLVSPCFPTPEETRTLIENGYEDRLSISTFVDIRTLSFYDIVAPKAIKHEIIINGQAIPLNKCNFLDSNGLCILHDKGLKPIEGRLASCKNTEEKALQNRLDVCATWPNSALGQKLLEKFKLKHQNG